VTPLSLNKRLLFSASIILTIFFGFTAISLNNAFNASYEITQQKQLKNYIYMLLTAADFSQNGRVEMPQTLAETAFNTPNSGLYAQINSRSNTIWSSISTLGHDFKLTNAVSGQKEHFNKLSVAENNFLSLAYPVIWENDQGLEYAFTFYVTQDLTASKTEQQEFKHTLWYWLAGTGITLLLLQALILRLSLKPLDDVSQNLSEIQQGKTTRLSRDYPQELAELTTNLNSLLDQEQSRRQRYKHALADLAHSLKTPLAVLQNELDDKTSQQKRQSDSQLEQIIKLIDYQLQRAATEGQSALQAPIPLKNLLDKIINTLDKVYQAKGIEYHCNEIDDMTLHADEGDMYELLGNLHENAYKYGSSKVSTHVDINDEWVTITIDNDGPPIPKADQNKILQRGKRLDNQTEGQGLGLAIVSNILDAYEGRISVGTSQLKGACFVISIPNR